MRPDARGGRPSPTVPICPYGWDTKALTLVVRQRKGLELQILPCQLGWELKDAKATTRQYE